MKLKRNLTNSENRLKRMKSAARRKRKRRKETEKMMTTKMKKMMNTQRTRSISRILKKPETSSAVNKNVNSENEIMIAKNRSTMIKNA